MAHDLDRLAQRPHPALEALLLGVAQQFRPVDAAAAGRAVQRLSTGLALAAALPPAEQGPLAGELLGYDAGLRLARARAPDALLLDTVLRRRRGEPVLLAAVYAIAARRAGIPLSVAAAGSRWLVVHEHAGGAVVLDPAQSGAVLAGEEVPAGLRRRDSVAVTAAALRELTLAYGARRALREATRAAELRLALLDVTHPPAGERLTAH